VAALSPGVAIGMMTALQPIQIVQFTNPHDRARLAALLCLNQNMRIAM
jgi:hypothetical protein